jgi:hypothetical protein
MRAFRFRFSPGGMPASNSQAAEATERPATRPGPASGPLDNSAAFAGFEFVASYFV